MVVACPVHGESSVEQVEEVLSRMSEDDLRTLADADPLKIANAISTVSGHRCLAKMRELQTQFDALPAG